MNIPRFIICICLFIIASNAFGQEEADECHCIQPSHYYAPAGVFIDHVHAEKEWMLSYRYMQMNMRNNQSGNTKVSLDQVYNNYVMAPRSMNMQMHMLMLMYGLSDKITFMGMTSYVINSMRMSMMGSTAMPHMHTGSNNNAVEFPSTTSGLTDTKVYTLYQLVATNNYELVLSGGVNLPTGKNSLRGASMTAESEKYTYIMQPGTGNFAGLPGITYTWKNRTISGGGQLSSALYTGKNRENYRWGNQASLSSWVSHGWKDWLSNSLRADLTITDKIKGYDNEIAGIRSMDPTADINNYGGMRAAFYGGLNIVVSHGCLKGLRLSAEYGLPVYQNLNGLQMSIKSTLYTSLLYGF